MEEVAQHARRVEQARRLRVRVLPAELAVRELARGAALAEAGHVSSPTPAGCRARYGGSRGSKNAADAACIVSKAMISRILCNRNRVSRSELLQREPKIMAKVVDERSARRLARAPHEISCLRDEDLEPLTNILAVESTARPAEIEDTEGRAQLRLGRIGQSEGGQQRGSVFRSVCLAL